MKKVSFLFVLHFLLNPEWAKSEEGVISITTEKPQLQYKSVGNKFALSKTYLALEQAIKDVNRNIFSIMTGIIAKSIHNAKDISSAIRSSAFVNANAADKLFNLIIEVDIDGVVKRFTLEALSLGTDPITTARNIYIEMIKAVAGDDDMFEAFVKRTPETAEQLAYMLAPFGVKLENCMKDKTELLEDAVTQSVKELRAYKKEVVRGYLNNSGIAALKKARIALRENNSLLENPGAVKGKLLVAENAAAETVES